jgi:hypothetical protein
MVGLSGASGMEARRAFTWRSAVVEEGGVSTIVSFGRRIGDV